MRFLLALLCALLLASAASAQVQVLGCTRKGCNVVKAYDRRSPSAAVISYPSALARPNIVSLVAAPDYHAAALNPETTESERAFWKATGFAPRKYWANAHSAPLYGWHDPPPPRMSMVAHGPWTTSPPPDARRRFKHGIVLSGPSLR